eukprot:m.1573 g.1573  ORF g.1573 m.1573 type:complete len:123 (-) comp362_c1_seq1:49-417(-)
MLTLQLRQTLSTLPPGIDASVQSTGGGLAVTQDGGLVIASNRGHDSITTFSVDDSGLLQFCTCVSTGGRTPRHFTLAPTGRHVLVANQDSDEVAVFHLGRDGVLSPTGCTHHVPSPNFICFI